MGDFYVVRNAEVFRLEPDALDRFFVVLGELALAVQPAVLNEQFLPARHALAVVAVFGLECSRLACHVSPDTVFGRLFLILTGFLHRIPAAGSSTILWLTLQ